MATEAATIAFLLEQLGADVSARKMFGEYALYAQGKVVALVCDDSLFVKPTAAGQAFLGTPDLAPAYPGARPSFRIDPDRWDDADWLRELIRITEPEIPAPKPRKTKAAGPRKS